MTEKCGENLEIYRFFPSKPYFIPNIWREYQFDTFDLQVKDAEHEYQKELLIITCTHENYKRPPPPTKDSGLRTKAIKE